MELTLILIIFLQIIQTFFNNIETIILVSNSLSSLPLIKEITFGITINYLYDTLKSLKLLKSLKYKPKHHTQPKLKHQK